MTITTTQTTELKLAPALKRRLLTKLRTYADLYLQAKTLKAAQGKLKDEVESLFIDADEFAALQDGAAVEGFRLKYVSPVRKKLNIKKLLAQGVTLAQIAQATDEVPTKPYTKITVPGEKDDDE